MSKKEQWMFLQKMGRLLDASLSIEDALGISARHIKNKAFRRSVALIQNEIANGISLSESLRLQEKVWSKSVIALVSVGELSGALSANLLRAAENMRSKSERAGKMIAALFYPAIISVLALGMIVFLLTFVYPKITPLFIGMKTALPLSTRMVIRGSAILGRFWAWFIFTPAIFVITAYYLITEFSVLRICAERFILSIPGCGRIVLTHQLSELAFIVGSLCQGGMNISDALSITTSSGGFVIVRDSFAALHSEIASGMSLSESLKGKALFPQIWNDLVIVGEETGTLAASFLSISEIHRQDIDETMSMVNKLIEPLMMIMVGVVVGFIALSIITPMYSLTQHV
jgi:type IV pilus assembly protein PilC